MAQAFDALEYYEKLKTAGVPEAQARVLADILCTQNESQVRAFKAFTDEQEEKARREFATKEDLRFQKEINDQKLKILICKCGIVLTLIALMLRAFAG